ncbi:hypothetical protein GC093_32310 [Paenibacillus sp. LMG 31456]|uniref:Uncharacterized protein n=1 Tax=Paenibacillus foliorum TaxID=2654974 RepID=A0A972H398_9BACL|nr:hypothetical protein [Paenibacillus foliorum]
MAQFQVTQTSRTENTLIIKGTLLEGQISEGMEVRVSLQLSAGNCRCLNQVEIELWEMLKLNGNVINIC